MYRQFLIYYKNEGNTTLDISKLRYMAVNHLDTYGKFNSTVPSEVSLEDAPKQKKALAPGEEYVVQLLIYDDRNQADFVYFSLDNF
ncbi:hypothetical protein [Saccharibacillus deserti]|uniref:hypothetical protein n=1 Tax=Saccharibacillus deserti TaxID=1634444 RepID=UPI001554985A|nr:hypothetical protein [Saccharibacillus deserti]